MAGVPIVLVRQRVWDRAPGRDQTRGVQDRGVGGGGAIAAGTAAHDEVSAGSSTVTGAAGKACNRHSTSAATFESEGGRYSRGNKRSIYHSHRSSSSRSHRGPPLRECPSTPLHDSIVGGGVDTLFTGTAGVVTTVGCYAAIVVGARGHSDVGGNVRVATREQS